MPSESAVFVRSLTDVQGGRHFPIYEPTPAITSRPALVLLISAEPVPATGTTALCASCSAPRPIWTRLPGHQPGGLTFISMLRGAAPRTTPDCPALLRGSYG